MQVWLQLGQALVPLCATATGDPCEVSAGPRCQRAPLPAAQCQHRAQLPRACHQRPMKARSALEPPGETAMLRQKAKAPTAWAGGHSSQVTTGLGEWRGIRWAHKYGSLLLRLGCWARAILPQSCQHPAPLRERPRAKGKVPHPFRVSTVLGPPPPKSPNPHQGLGLQSGTPDVVIAGHGGRGHTLAVFTSGRGYTDLSFGFVGLCV